MTLERFGDLVEFCIIELENLEYEKVPPGKNHGHNATELASGKGATIDPDTLVKVILRG